MAYRIFDYRTDVRNLEITPEVRARFIRLSPHEVHERHSHDLGHEIFLVLEGQAEIEIDGERAILGPGQLCFVRAGQLHQVRNAGAAPLTLYLSVTPHIEPTHTHWDDQGNKLPPRYGGATAREREEAGAVFPPIADLAARQLAAIEQLERSVRAAIPAHDRLRERAAAAERDAAIKETVDALWAELYPLFRAVSALALAWNDLAAAAGAVEYRP